MRSLIIGGTRNLGPSIVQALLQQGHQITTFNRGQTQDDLPREIERLHGDRTAPAQFKAALGNREFDLVIDTTLYTGAEAHAVVELFSGRIGRYIFLSTGQVYLVRLNVQRPFKESDYAGSVMAAPPKSDSSEYENWLYGADKRAAEDVFAQAWTDQKFPFTSLRLPMVNSERDHYDRIYGYFLRIQDGGPLLIPEGSGLPVRHVYGEDVVQAILHVISREQSKGTAYNIGQDETQTLDQFLAMLADLLGKPLNIVRVPREKLKQEGLLPECSPFSGLWMSCLENAFSKAELEMRYTPVSTYVKKLVDYFQAAPTRKIEGYGQRSKELAIAKVLSY
jgi:nucleoside-diphosphate-sugar epimerase